jgi:hypothetical protein
MGIIILYYEWALVEDSQMKNPQFYFKRNVFICNANNTVYACFAQRMFNTSQLWIRHYRMRLSSLLNHVVPIVNNLNMY